MIFVSSDACRVEEAALRYSSDSTFRLKVHAASLDAAPCVAGQAQPGVCEAAQSLGGLCVDQCGQGKPLHQCTVLSPTNLRTFYHATGLLEASTAAGKSSKVLESVDPTTVFVGTFKGRLGVTQHQSSRR